MHAPWRVLSAPKFGARGTFSLESVFCARVVRSRLNPTILAEAFARMPQPCRVVVSGPGGFNSAAREMLLELVDDEEQITILSA